MLRPKQKFLAFLLFPLLLVSALPALAQRRPAPRKAPAPAQVAEPVVSFDTLLADDQYRLYSEVRNVGTLVRSQNFTELLEPLVQLADPPKQFSTVLKWIQAHADTLAGSRLFAASMPAKNTLPQFIFAIEMASVPEAKKLEAELRAFVPKLDPKPNPLPTSSPEPTTQTADNPGTFSKLQIQQVGTVLLLSDKQISVVDLRPPRRRLLAENPNFVLTRSRFAAEPVFLYVDFKGIEKEELKQRERWAEQARRQEEAIASQKATPDSSPEPVPEEQLIGNPESELQVPPPEDLPEGTEVVPLEPTGPEAQLNQSINTAMYPLSMALFGGRAKFPEALGVALAFEGDSYAVRALVVNSPENRSLPIPFIPQLASGPPLTPSSPNIFPGEVDLFVVLSVDYSQIHDAMVKALADQPWLSVMGPNEIRRPTTPFSTLEEKTGVKVKEDLLPLLGNEIAFILLRQSAAETTPRDDEPDNEDRRSVRLPELLPVIAVSIKDRDAVKQVIPKMFESMGLKGAAKLAHTEKRGDAEIVSFANLFSYAFAGDFLILSSDPALTRRAVDSYVSNDTLSSNSKFRSATRWQGRQVQGQVFLSADLVDKYMFAGRNKPQPATTPGQPIEPLTYMLSNEGAGPVHEAHVPRSLLQMVVAGITSKADESPIFTNESIAKNMLRTIAAAQATFRKTKGDGRYGSLDELSAEGLFTKDLLERYGYKIELSVVSNRFEVTAAPVEYGKTGKRSFYIDESGVLRGGDHGGGAATLSDKQINE